MSDLDPVWKALADPTRREILDFLRGGPEFGVYTLSRFYAMHMLLIPGLIAALIGAHIYLVTKLGTTAPPWLKAEKKDLLTEEI